MGDYLIVGLSSDEFNLLKHEESYHKFEERKLILESIKYVDEVIAENAWEQKEKDIIENKVDIFVMRDDYLTV